MQIEKKRRRVSWERKVIFEVGKYMYLIGILVLIAAYQ